MAEARADLVQRVARAIAARRRALGLTQEALAERLLMATKNVQRIEAGQNLTLDTLARVAAALETAPAALLDAGPSATATPASVQRLKDAGFAVRPASAPGRRSPLAVPLMTIQAAAGAARGGSRAVEALAWVTLQRKGAPPASQFIATIEGHSMEPRVHDGALCLFGPPGPPPYRSRIFLVAHDAIDEEGLEGPFALKQIESKPRRDGSRRIVLKSLNPDFPPISLNGRETELRVVAELVDVLVNPIAGLGDGGQEA